MNGYAGDVEPIAVVGLSVRVPGANTVDQYWRNICNKIESVSWFESDELRAAGVADGLVSNPSYVPASCVLPDADLFDAEFFGISHAEAAMLDPQHRLFLECAWQALEDAGHDPRRFEGTIGVYGGSYMNKYLPYNLYTNDAFVRSPGAYFARNYNDKDFITGHVAYLLNLRGPAVTIQTACSTSLVATHLACQSLLAYDCDLALAGGVAVNVPLKAGYLALEGTMFTPEGRCRPFDSAARGTLPGNGAALVALRRLSDALADGDHIRAVIRGTAINNDGSSKLSFTAPNPNAQSEVIAAAQTVAGVHPDSIGYVEAHGTGTLLGDPIEVGALTAAFRLRSDRSNYCALGSVKANIGHLDAAAGAVGLARAILALERKCIPPQANFAVPNPELKLESSPFYVPTEAVAWKSNGTPRRAAVSSFAVGGTNAHAVLEEAPAPVFEPARSPSRHLIVVSARDRGAVDAAAAQLADSLEAATAVNLADVAHTLAVGRSEFSARRIAVGADAQGVAKALRDNSAPTIAASGDKRVVFMFPGVGTQYPDMALDIYDAEPVFREQVDLSASLLRDRLGMDIRAYLFASRYPAARVDHESVPHALAAIFTIEHALAKLWMSWGVRPDAMLGHSLGEYVAACIAGVLSLSDALDLTVRRGEIFNDIPDGRMVGVPLPADEVVTLLDPALSLGAVNAPGLCMVSGPRTQLEALIAVLAARDVECRMLPIRMASHSQMVDPFLDGFATTVAGYTLSSPTIPFLSCATGEWITPEQATSPAYWARQLRSTVQFSKMVCEAASQPHSVLVEVGPGTTLTTLAGAQRLAPRPHAVSSLRHPTDPRSDYECLLTALGRLWQAGLSPHWHAIHGSGARRVPLPTYPFQRKRYWIAAGRTIGPGASALDVPGASDTTIADIAASNGHDTATAPTKEPCSKREQVIIDIWRDLLGVEEVGLDDDFEALGGHSLLAAQMLPHLRALCTASLRITDLFAAPTVRKLAALMDSREAVGATGTTLPGVDFAAEVVLDPAVRAAGLPPMKSGQSAHVLLTGATGFLGTYLLSELLRQTAATVHCLVRAKDKIEGESRLRARLQAFGLPAPSRGRLVAVPGDLQKPRLGMSGAQFEGLAETIDAIYHCGAWVNFARPYMVLKQANVGGTEEVLRLATRRRLKTVHHVSTIFVTMGSITTGVPFIAEDDPLPPVVGHDTAYTESKWVAEGLCRLAVERGVPVAVYRPGNIFGDSVTGVANSVDYFSKLFQGCIRLGVAPLRRFSLPVGTVDDVARTIVLLSLRGDVAGRTYHVIHPEPLEWDSLFHHLRQFGYDVPSVPWEQWRAALARQLSASTDNVLAPLADMIGNVPANRQMPKFGVENAARVRRQVGLPYPVLDQTYFSTLFRHLNRINVLPPVNTPSVSPEAIVRHHEGAYIGGVEATTSEVG